MRDAARALARAGGTEAGTESRVPRWCADFKSELKLAVRPLLLSTHSLPVRYEYCAVRRWHRSDIFESHPGELQMPLKPH